MFEIGCTYQIDNKPFRYDGKVRDMERHQFTSIDNPDDVREVSIFASRYLYEIQRSKR